MRYRVDRVGLWRVTTRSDTGAVISKRIIKWFWIKSMWDDIHTTILISRSGRTILRKP
jgi:hypothetical protein